MKIYYFVFSAQSHLDAVTRVKLAEIQPMKKIVEQKIQINNESALGYLWAAYHLAKRELPKEEFPHMLNLVEMSGKDLKETPTLVTVLTMEFQNFSVQ